MNRTAWIALMLAFGVSTATVFAQDAKKDDKKPAAGKPDDKKPDAKAEASDGPMCPVMQDDPIDPEVFVRYRGKRVYLCCGECIDKFKADPDKYAAGAKKQWERMKPLRMQVKCPVTGGKLDRQFYFEMPREDVYFASADALEKFKKDRKTYEAKLNECFTYQTMCPVSNKEINPEAGVEIAGKTVYFCCNACVEDGKKGGEATVKRAAEQAKKNEDAFAKQNAKGDKKP